MTQQTQDRIKQEADAFAWQRDGDNFTAGAKRGYEIAAEEMDRLENENALLKLHLEEMIGEFYYVVKSEDNSRVRAIELLENLKS